MPTALGTLVRPGAVAGGGPFTPASFTGAIEWWDPAASGSITSSSNLVSQWTGQIAGKNFAQATGTYQPETGTQTINGVNVINFDRATKSQMVCTTIPNTSQPFWLAYIIWIPATPTLLRVVDSEGAGTGGRILIGPNNNTNVQLWAGGATTSDYNLSATTAYQVVGQWNGASGVVYVNGTSQSTGNVGTTTSGNWFALGGGNGVPGVMGAWIGDYVFGSGVMSAGDRSSWATWVNGKWAI